MTFQEYKDILKFNGVEYRSHSWTANKKDALARAKFYRLRGYIVRMRKTDDHYRICIRHPVNGIKIEYDKDAWPVDINKEEF